MSRNRVILTVLTALLATGSAGEAISLDSPGTVESFSSTDNCFPEAVDTSNTLKLQSGRFEAALLWLDSNGKIQVGYPRPMTRDPMTRASGFFSFDLQGSPEVALKVLDGHEITGTYWAFHAGLTNVEYKIWIKDKDTGKCLTYYNEPGKFFSNGDLNTFVYKAEDLANSTANLVASFDIDPAEPGVREEVRFTDTSVPTPDTWCWRFGDERPGSPPCTADTKVVTRPYERTGTFEVTLSVSWGDGPSVTMHDTSKTLRVVLCNLVLKGQRQFAFEGTANGVVTVGASSSDCAWKVANKSLDVIEMTDPTSPLPSRRGTGTVKFKVLRNETNRERPGVLVINEGLINERQWTVKQLANPRACCIKNATTLCLLNGRFEVSATFPRVNGKNAKAVAIGKDGYFWISERTNAELVVKMVVDGINGGYSFFYGGLTNLDYDLIVRDSATGTAVIYKNRGGQFTSKGDTQSFSSQGGTCG